MSSLSREMVRAITGGIVVVAAGYGIMKATTPTDKEFYDSLSPSLKRQVDAARAQGVQQQTYTEQIRLAQQKEQSPLGRQV